VTSTEPTTASPKGAGPAGDDSIVKKLSTLDRYLAVWILLAMAVGLGLGRLIPGMNDALAKIEIGGISLPIALGLLVMMYPVLAKVRYDRLDRVTSDQAAYELVRDSGWGIVLSRTNSLDGLDLLAIQARRQALLAADRYRIGRSRQRHGRLQHQGLLLLMDFNTHEVCRRPYIHARQAGNHLPESPHSNPRSP
jgi:hypothetical protein